MNDNNPDLYLDHDVDDYLKTNDIVLDLYPYSELYPDLYIYLYLYRGHDDIDDWKRIDEISMDYDFVWSNYQQHCYNIYHYYCHVDDERKKMVE